ncbi:NAD(P)/FAD-dependent oxidoreductase [Burkholderiaceae bacterium]|nr:NAD(P)/FAD-dependent oxidoreductase [Burkholderiaceae bacterium]
MQTPSESRYDAIIVGAGAAGLMCASVAGQRGLRVLLIDHAKKIAEKIRISGGGRCNFTNIDLDTRNPQQHFISENPRFCKHALAAYTPADFIQLMGRHGLTYTEKHKGQLFCDQSSAGIIDMLLTECRNGGVDHRQETTVHNVRYTDDQYVLDTSMGAVSAPSLVIATGGLSIPKIGATDWGYQVAKQFALPLQALGPALVPLTFDGVQWQAFSDLAGLALPVRIQTASSKIAFDEDLLFTHRGLSGPAILQISSYHASQDALKINLCPDKPLEAHLLALKAHSKKQLVNELTAVLPQRLSNQWLDNDPELKPLRERPTSDVPDKAMRRLAESLQHWRLQPSGTEGYAKAEVTAGGVDTRHLDPKTMQAKAQRGLYFIGEVTDITGWLGGYNFQWAWSSAVACGKALHAKTESPPPPVH